MLDVLTWLLFHFGSLIRTSKSRLYSSPSVSKQWPAKHQGLFNHTSRMPSFWYKFQPEFRVVTSKMPQSWCKYLQSHAVNTSILWALIRPISLMLRVSINVSVSALWGVSMRDPVSPVSPIQVLFSFSETVLLLLD